MNITKPPKASRWHDNLPDSCPPTDAREVAGEVFYRFVKNSPCTHADLNCWRADYPDRWAKDECMAHACSVFNDYEHMLLSKGIAHVRKHYKFIAKLEMQPGSGLIKETGQPKHYSWWKSQGFSAVTSTSIQSKINHDN